MKNDNIQMQIDIIYKTIDKYNKALNCDYDNDVIIAIKEKIKYEEKKLSFLKDKFAQYFI